ncbi:MAG TPA: hypothetical protein VG917_00280 [Patescibacteria group bacterium]|nr:hypothetical protein [Patescibacteria group bacterium]
MRQILYIILLVTLVIFGVSLFNKFTNDYFNSKSINKLVAENNSKQIGLLLNIFGPEKVVKKLYDEYLSSYSFDCNKDAYYVGKVSYRVLKDKALDDFIQYCNSGYMQGSVREYIYQTGLDDFQVYTSSLCGRFETKFKELECYHAVGNGLLASAKGDTYRALKLCGYFNTYGKRGSCYLGVFIESNGSLGTNYKQNSLNKNVCEEYEDNSEIAKSCYLVNFPYLTLKSLKTSDLRKIAPACLNVRNKDNISNCFFGYGIRAAIISNYVPDKIVDLCVSVPADMKYRASCFSGAVAGIVDFFGPELGSRGNDYCSFLPNEYRSSCLANLSSRLKIVSETNN